MQMGPQHAQCPHGTDSPTSPKVNMDQLVLAEIPALVVGQPQEHSLHLSFGLLRGRKDDTFFLDNSLKSLSTEEMFLEHQLQVNKSYSAPTVNGKPASAVPCGACYCLPSSFL